MSSASSEDSRVVEIDDCSPDQYEMHAEYVVWCPYCVAGKRPNNHHRRRKGMSKLPMLSADYAYIGDGDLLTVLVVHVKPYGVVFACVADAKGPTPYMVRMLAEWIKMCGLVSFLYRSDKEASIVRLIEDAVKESGREGNPMDEQQLDLRPCARLHF